MVGLLYIPILVGESRFLGLCSGSTTVQSVRNAKVIAFRNEKQVKKLTSGERGALVTVLYAANAAGNSIPTMLIFL